MLRTGDLLDNKYRILSEIGRGGMSVVYLAINERANKTWAVKEVRKDGVMDSASVRQRLMVETDMMKRLKHPNLPCIVDVIDSDESFYIVMDYIEGKSLLSLLKSGGAVPEDKAVRWGKQMCDVLGYLHEQDPPVIYRDMKPANVMLKPDGNIALIDFGTAREFKDRAMTEDTTCLGTRGYAAPEQFGGRGQTDARTDIYCLGATLYHLLTGHSPAEPPYEIKPVSYWIPQYAGSGLEKMILKCTRQDPAERYQDCGELMYALEHYRDEDDAVLKMRKRQIRAFIAALAVGCASLTAAMFFRSSLENVRQNSYESRIDQAMMQDTLKDAAPFFRQALEVKAGDSLAYESLLEKSRAEIAKDGKLTTEDAQIIRGCLTADAGGTGTNIDVLAREDPKAYTDVMYETGLWYFFMKDSTPEDIQNANIYFKKITEEPYISFLEGGRREMLLIMSRIGDYIGSLNSDISKIGSGTQSSYSALYADLKDIVSGDLRSRVETDYYTLAVYKRAAYWINEDHQNFIGDGVIKEELVWLLDTIGAGAGSLGIQEDNRNYREYQETMEVIRTARRTVDRIRP